MTRILNTRILGALAMILFVGAIVASSTGAFFSDTETSTGNTFTAGAIDLKIDNSSYGFDWNNPEDDEDQVLDGDWIQNSSNSWALSDLDGELFFSFVDLKPGDYGEDTISIHVQNDAYACMAMDLTSTPENLVNEAEAEGPPADVTAGEQEGELQNYLNFAFWNDDGDNVYENNEGPLLFQGLASALDGTWQTIADSEGDPIPANTEQAPAYMGKFWCFGDLEATPVAPDDYGAPTADNTGFQCDGSGDNNDAQTDGIGVDVSFYAVQARNNGNFLCSDLNRGEELPDPILTLRKQVNQDGVDPVADAAWTLNATGAVVVTGTDNDPDPSPAITNISVPAGDYTLTEDGEIPGFTFEGIQCTDGVLLGNVLTLANGDNATCTFTNIENIQ